VTADTLAYGTVAKWETKRIPIKPIPLWKLRAA
jgi:hypothetical protein